MVQDHANPHQTVESQQTDRLTHPCSNVGAAPSQTLAETGATSPGTHIWVCSPSCHWPEETAQLKRQEGRKMWKCL